MEQLEFKFDTQLLIDGEDLDEDVIHDYIVEHFKGDCLLVVGDDTLIKIHFHTNEPWQILEYGQSIGDIYDVVVENMQRQEASKAESCIRFLREPVFYSLDNKKLLFPGADSSDLKCQYNIDDKQDDT